MFSYTKDTCRPVARHNIIMLAEGLLEEERQDKTRQDKTRQDKTRQDKTRQDKTRQDKTRQLYYIFTEYITNRPGTAGSKS